jgi:hypothetical protein
VPREGHKGNIITEGKSPLQIPMEKLENIRMIIVSVETYDKSYENEERTLSMPYENYYEIKLSRKPSPTIQSSENSYQSSYSYSQSSSYHSKGGKEKELKQEVARRSLKTRDFEIIDPSLGYYKGALSTFYQPAVFFQVKNIGSSDIKMLFFKAVFTRGNVAMGENTYSVQNIYVGYQSPDISIVCPSGWEMEDVSLGSKIQLYSMLKEINVRLFWSTSAFGPWNEIPNFNNALDR